MSLFPVGPRRFPRGLPLAPPWGLPSPAAPVLSGACQRRMGSCRTRRASAEGKWVWSQFKGIAT